MPGGNDQDGEKEQHLEAGCFGADRWETVLRVGDSLSPHGESTFQQTALGLNYLFRPGTQLKLSWEINDSDNAEAEADRVLLQLAHGF